MLFVNSTREYDERNSYFVNSDNDDYEENEQQDPYDFSPKWAR